MKRSKLTWIGSAIAAGLVAYAVGSAIAQQSQPASREVRTVQTITGSSERGVSAALKDAVDKIPVPKGDQVIRFRLVNVSGEKSARASVCSVEIEVSSDKP